jgi:hypothetical protein
MTKKIRFICLIFLSLFLIAGCNNQDGNSNPHKNDDWKPKTDF